MPGRRGACSRSTGSQRGGRGDLQFLERVFHKLLLNFTWWVNRKDAEGRNVFQGGFLGLDNIGVFDRSKALPTGGFIDQSDGTSWMAMYSLNMMRIALELARHNTVYEDIATKFFEHFLHIAEAMTNMGEAELGLWDEEDKFFYDVLHMPNGKSQRLKVRSMVGLIPLFAVETIDAETLRELPGFAQRLQWFLNYRPDLAALVSHWDVGGTGERRLLSLLRGQRMKRLLKRMLDETEFLSEFGVRALSRHHAEHPYEFRVNGDRLVVAYQPAESDTGLFGGNSNWRGPIWFPVNFLIIESLQKFHYYYGDDFKVECPTGSGNYMTHQGSVGGTDAPAGADFPEGARRQAPGIWRGRTPAERSALPRSSAVLRVLPRRHGTRCGRIAPDRLDGPDRQAAAAASPGRVGAGVSAAIIVEKISRLKALLRLLLPDLRLHFPEQVGEVRRHLCVFVIHADGSHSHRYLPA